MMPRVLELSLVINGVVNPGNVEVKELPVSSFQGTVDLICQCQPDVVIGNAIQVTLLDGADLAFNSDCEAIGYSPGLGCGGSETVKLSFANAPLDLNGSPLVLLLFGKTFLESAGSI